MPHEVDTNPGPENNMATIKNEEQFWTLLATATPSMRRYEALLMELDQRGLENVYGLFWTFATWVEDDEGTLVSGENGGHHLSEDSIEDLGRWIVGQGETFWNQVRDDLGVLGEVFLLMSRVEGGQSAEGVRWEFDDGEWPGGRQSHLGMAAQIYENRFGASIWDIEGEVIERASALVD